MDHVHIHDNLVDVCTAGVNDWVSQAVTCWHWCAGSVCVILAYVVTTPHSVESFRRSKCCSCVVEARPVTTPIHVWIVVGVRCNSISTLNSESEFVGFLVVASRVCVRSTTVCDEVVVVRILVRSTRVVSVTVKVAVPNWLATLSTIVGVSTSCNRWVIVAPWVVTSDTRICDVGQSTAVIDCDSPAICGHEILAIVRTSSWVGVTATVYDVCTNLHVVVLLRERSDVNRVRSPTCTLATEDGRAVKGR